MLAMIFFLKEYKNKEETFLYEKTKMGKHENKRSEKHESGVTFKWAIADPLLSIEAQSQQNKKSHNLDIATLEHGLAMTKGFEGLRGAAKDVGWVLVDCSKQVFPQFDAPHGASHWHQSAEVNLWRRHGAQEPLCVSFCCVLLSAPHQLSQTRR